MQKIFLSEKGYYVVKKNKEKLEKALDITLEFDGKTTTVKSRKNDSFIEYITEKILDALALGFDIDTALQLQDTDFILKKIDIRAYAKKSRVNIVKGRIIGTKGKTKDIIEKLSDCDIVVSDHNVAIIGKTENVDLASHAIRSLIRGSPQSKVYAFLERSHNRLKELAEEDIEEIIEKE